MTEPADPDAAAESPPEVTAGVTVNGIAVEKVVSMYKGVAAAVSLTIRSNRDEPCRVRVVEALPERLSDADVEFHPNYDPENWTRANELVVYEREIDPRVEVNTVYGVAIDDPTQLELFSADPAIKLLDGGAGEPSAPTPAGRAAEEERDPPEADGTAASSPDSEFSFEETHWANDGEGETDDGDPAGGSAASGPEAADIDGPPAGAVEDGAVGAIVAELQRRSLTETERAAFRDALELDGSAVNARLRAIDRDVEAIHESLAAMERQAAEIERLEARLEAVSSAAEERYDTLAAEVDALAETVEQEVRWRDQLRRAVDADPDWS